MTNEAEVREWLDYAEADRVAAKHLLQSGDFAACAFHCQQAIEKLLKAIVVAETGKRPPYWHSLRLLLEEINTIEIPKDVIWRTVQIEPHYVGSRCPGVVDPTFYSSQNMEGILAQTLEVFEWFLIKLNEMGRSNSS